MVDLDIFDVVENISQEAGFECAYLSGFAVSATRLAEPDIGTNQAPKYYI